jgi:hypothetical protein
VLTRPGLQRMAEHGLEATLLDERSVMRVISAPEGRG